LSVAFDLYWQRLILATPSFLATPFFLVTPSFLATLSFLAARVFGDACRHFEREKDKD